MTVTNDAYRLLQLLSKKQIKSLKANMLYQLQNINKKQSEINWQIFDYIMSILSKNSHFNKEKLYAFVPSIATETDKQLNKRLTIIKQAILQFIVDCELQESENEIQALLSLLGFFKSKSNAEHFFIETQGKIKYRLEKKWREKNIDIINYHYAHKLHAMLIGHEAFRKEQIIHLNKSLYYSEAYFLSQQLNYYCHFMNVAINNHKKPTHYNTIYFKPLSVILQTLPQQNIFRETIIEVYYKVYEMLNNWEGNQKRYYETYISFLFADYKKNKKLKNFEIFTPTVQQNLLAYAQNCLTWKINKIDYRLKRDKFSLSEVEQTILIAKKQEYLHSLFDLYELQLKHDMITEISVNLMRNIILKMLNAGFYERLELFVENHIFKVVKENRNIITNYAYAKLSFAKKEYEKVIELLLKESEKTKQMPNYFFKTDSYRLLIKSIFEIADYETLEKYINRFRTYLTNNEAKKNVALFERHKRFLVYVKELSEAAKQNDSLILTEFKDKIERRKDAVDSEWLIGKVEMYLN
ncbi:MAG: hypothetical protein ACPG5B_07715 [Chitinophagales bacterium]